MNCRRDIFLKNNENVVPNMIGEVFQALEGLKGASSKPFGNLIVVPIFCF